MEPCPAAEPPPKKQRTEEVTPPLIAPEQQLSAEQQASREKQLEHVFELCARARPGISGMMVPRAGIPRAEGASPTL